MSYKVKVLLWDIDNTLLDFNAAEEAAIRSCFRILELGVCTDEMLLDYSQINRKYWEMLERGEMTKPEILVGRFREFFEKYGLNVEAAGPFNEEYQVRLGDTCIYFPYAEEILRKYQGVYPQYAVTNGTKIAQTRKLKNSGMGEILDGVFISEEIGIEKPGRGFFDHVFAATGNHDPQEYLIIGDSLTSDMKGGVNAGIRTCWFNPTSKENTSGLKLDYEIRSLKELEELLEQN